MSEAVDQRGRVFFLDSPGRSEVIKAGRDDIAVRKGGGQNHIPVECADGGIWVNHRKVK